MSITTADLNAYGSANRPKDDTTTSGGAIDDQRRPVFTPLTANSVLAVNSDYTTDTRTVNIEGRDSTGAIQTEGVALTGTTPVAGSQVWERIQDVFAASADAAPTVTVRQGIAGALIGTIPPNEFGFFRMFQRSASEASQTQRYEKLFWRNDHPTLTLNDAKVTLTADPSAKIEIGLATAKDDSGSVANRESAPGGVSFVDDGVAQNVPTTILAAGEAIGVWVRMTLAANDSPVKSTFTTQLSGTSV